MKAGNQRIAMITAYDYTMARLVDAAGIDMVLVGDSLGMVIQGHDDTLSVTMEDMIYHSRCVSKGLQQAHLTVDMPFMSYQISVEQALKNAGRLIKKGSAQSVKLEGGERTAPMINSIVRAGIPVVGHLGLTPQSIHVLGGFRVQGRDEEAKRQLLRDAKAIEEAGAFALVLEMIPLDVTHEISRLVDIPIIGIGAGPLCDGQVLVCNDLLGFDTAFHPRFLKRYANLENPIISAVKEYIHEVKTGVFPAPEHSFGSQSQKAKLARVY